MKNQLYGLNTFVLSSKIFCGTDRWVGHLSIYNFIIT
nr:MAG TPA: hypothetical protein [Caudoviricetes sp.]